ncbi:hypothetical protein HMPREF3226_01100 [Prevotella corporis]|uniref:Uncharacterized protein n=1 Tax=Prevotella corporis TaxID=28128 RepID=A0A133QAJ6_9BACT|nr:hypothetical protein HMPREF3226_01100 [Prevotella corporis]
MLLIWNDRLATLCPIGFKNSAKATFNQKVSIHSAIGHLLQRNKSPFGLQLILENEEKSKLV